MLTVRKIVASAAVAALITTGSSAAVASTSAPPQAATAVNPWVTLSMLTPVSASVLGSAAATAAQPDQGPPPPQGGIGNIPIGVLIGWLAMIAVVVYLGTKSNGHHEPNSPA